MSADQPRVRIGISGWRYAPWRGVFYPPKLPQRQELEYAGRTFDSVELNGSFYSLQRPESYRRWRDETPEGFVFAVKGPRFITHMLRLRNARTPLANFFASGVLALGEKLGPVLWQLPERHGYDAEQLGQFFDLLPRSTTAVAALATEHDDKVKDRTHLTAEAALPIRHALEVRSSSFVNDEFYELLRRHDIGLVVADTANRWPLLTEVTSDFVYVRLHGAEELYVSGYSEGLLTAWAERIAGWTSGATCPDGRGRDVYVYFDNDAKVHAPFDALALRALVDQAPGHAEMPPPKRGHFVSDSD